MDISLQYHNNSFQAHERNKRFRKRRIEWLQDVESFLNVMKFGTEGLFSKRKDNRTIENCFISTRRVSEQNSIQMKSDDDTTDKTKEEIKEKYEKHKHLEVWNK